MKALGILRHCIFVSVVQAHICIFFPTLILRIRSHQASLCLLQRHRTKRDTGIGERVLIRCFLLLKTENHRSTNEEMGCFPTKECHQWSADEDLDLDVTPLLNESSRPKGYIQDDHATSTDRGREIDVDTDPKLETLLLKLEHAQGLRQKIRRCTSRTELENYRLKVISVLDAATIEMSRMTIDPKQHDAERVVKEIMRLRNVLGDKFFEAARINAFGREITQMGPFLLTGGQYFKPVMVNEDDDTIVKLFFFVISHAETAQVLFRYYLEHASFLDEYFALGLVIPEGHTQVEIYGSSCPPYWKIRQDVINNATIRLRSRFEDSNQSEFESSVDYDNLSDSLF